MTGSDTGGGIEAFTRQSGAFLNLVHAVHDSGEGIREVETEQPADEVRECAKLGDGHGDDKGEDPVQWTETPPEVLASLIRDRR